MAHACEVMFVNKSEAEKIFGDGSSIAELLAKMHKAGVKTPVITDGVNGSCASDGRRAYHMDIYPFKAIERTGAGDSYACGFVSACAWGLDLAQAMQWGSANSASVVQKIGPQDGLLTRKEIETFIKRKECRGIVPKPLI